MRKFCFIIASIFGAGLAAETIGNVEFKFPPSTYDWVLLTETNTYFPAEDSSSERIEMKAYTHKAGDALEFFIALSFTDEDGDEELEGDEHFETAEFTQLFINDLLMDYFPNHRVAITNLIETKEDGLLEWEMNDGIQQILHGLCRHLRTNGKDVILSYMTTALKSAKNSALWSDALYQAGPGN